MKIRLIGSLIACLCGFGCGAAKHELVRWPDGTNDCYAIEADHGSAQLVVIPDVQLIQKNARFITGKASWKYINGYYPQADGSPDTNEFWFVVDKRRFLMRDTVISLDYAIWSSWCLENGAPTNLQDVFTFRKSIPSQGGGGPEL